MDRRLELHSNRNPKACYMAVRGGFSESAMPADASKLRHGG